MPYWSESFRFNFPKSLNNWPHHASSAEKPERPKDSARAAKKTPAGPDQKTPKILFSKKTIVLLRLVLKLLFHCFVFLMKRSNFARPGASCWCITGQKRWVASTTRMAREDYLCSLVLRASNLLTVAWGPQEPCACHSEENMYPQEIQTCISWTCVYIYKHTSRQIPTFRKPTIFGISPFHHCAGNDVATTCPDVYYELPPPSKQPQKPWLRCRSVHFLAYRNICYICHDWPSNFDVLKHIVHTYNHIYIVYICILLCIPSCLTSFINNLCVHYRLVW